MRRQAPQGRHEIVALRKAAASGQAGGVPGGRGEACDEIELCCGGCPGAAAGRRREPAGPGHPHLPRRGEGDLAARPGSGLPADRRRQPRPLGPEQGARQVAPSGGEPDLLGHPAGRCDRRAGPGRGLLDRGPGRLRQVHRRKLHRRPARSPRSQGRCRTETQSRPVHEPLRRQGGLGRGRRHHFRPHLGRAGAAGVGGLHPDRPQHPQLHVARRPGQGAGRRLRRPPARRGAGGRGAPGRPPSDDQGRPRRLCRRGFRHRGGAQGRLRLLG